MRGLEELLPSKNLLVAGKDMAFSRLYTIVHHYRLTCVAWRTNWHGARLDLDEVKALFTKIESQSYRVSHWLPNMNRTYGGELVRKMLKSPESQQAFGNILLVFKGSSQDLSGFFRFLQFLLILSGSSGSSQEPSAAMERSAQTESTDKGGCRRSVVKVAGHYGAELVQTCGGRLNPRDSEKRRKAASSFGPGCGLFAKGWFGHRRRSA